MTFNCKTVLFVSIKNVKLLVLSSFMFFPTWLFAQNQKVKLPKEDITIQKIFQEIEKQTNLSIDYNRNKLSNIEQKRVLIKANSLAKVLDEALDGTGLTYKIEGEHILIIPTFSAEKEKKENSGKISGIVKDVNGEPVIGANVAIKGTSIGTVTDIDGKFSFDAPFNTKLTVSYIGYLTQEVSINEKKFLNIILKEDLETLDEVIVVGYGTQKKINLTGSVFALSGKDLSKRPVTNPSTMLQGQVPGLRVVQGLGMPGDESVSMRIRGVGTFSGAGADPLILINGVPGSMSNLDPSMIESVSVLKDAASCAIYGARAANGVVLITTKQGTDSEKVTIGYHGNFAFHSPTKMFDIVTNSVEYMELFNQAKKNSGLGGLYPEEEIEKYRQNQGSDQYPSFDWLDYLFNTAFVHQHNLSLAGTVKNTTFNVALNYVNQDGTLRSSNYTKYNVSADLTTKVNDFIKVGFYTNMMKGDRVYNGLGQDDAILSGMSQAPTYMPWLPDDGTGVRRYTQKAYDFETCNKNQVMIIDTDSYRHKDMATDVNANLWMDVNLLKGLTWYTKGAVRQYNNRSEYWIGNPVQLYYYHSGDKATSQGGYGNSVDESRILYTNLYSYLKYNWVSHTTNHNVTAMAGYSQETNKKQNIYAYRRDYVFNLETIDGGVGGPNWSNAGGEEEWALMSGFFRLNYNFKNRYLLEANARYDGSSRLSPNGRWGLFPSFSAAWRLTEEDFIKKMNLKWMTNAKLRGSWGKLGNQEIGLYPYQAMINKVNSYSFDKSAISSGYFQTAYVDRDIKWETTTVLDFGLDLQLLGKLDVTFDWYYKETDGILRRSQISGLLGMDAPIVNNGTMSDNGVELAVTWRDGVQIGTKRMDYSVGVYFDRTRNKLKNFGVLEKDDRLIREEGLPYNSYYMLECEGVFATEDEVRNSPKQYNDKTEAGDLKFKDVNRDGVVNNEDRVLISGRYPGFEYGFNMGANWNGFDFSLLAQGVADRKIYIDPQWGEAPFIQGSAPTKDYIKYMWTEENPYGAKYPKLYFNNMGGDKNRRTNSYFLKNASYMRLKNLTVGYTVPKSITQKMKIERLRFYFSGDNLLTLTSFTGLDPERDGDGRATMYPQNRICSFGVNLDF